MSKRRSQPHITPEYATAARAAVTTAHSECDATIAAALKTCRSKKTAAMRKRDDAVARAERRYREEIVDADTEFGLVTRLAKGKRLASRSRRVEILDRFAIDGNEQEAISQLTKLASN